MAQSMYICFWLIWKNELFPSSPLFFFLSPLSPLLSFPSLPNAPLPCPVLPSPPLLSSFLSYTPLSFFPSPVLASSCLNSPSLALPHHTSILPLSSSSFSPSSCLTSRLFCVLCTYGLPLIIITNHKDGSEVIKLELGLADFFTGKIGFRQNKCK